MPSPETLAVFAVASAGLVALPGPAVLYIATRGVVHGRRGALVSVLGVESGNFIAVLAATVGLAALISSSATAFSLIKYAGAAYLVWLGIRTLREGAAGAVARGARRRSDRRLYWEGFTVGALNPKLALFLLAFLPQFVDPAAGPVWLQTLVLGCVFSACAAIGDSIVGVVAAGAGSRLRRRLTDPGPLSRFAGLVYIGLGVTSALADGRRAHG